MIIGAQVIDAGTLYLIIGAALIFVACAYAAKRILRQLTMKQLGLISIITVLTLGVIWDFLPSARANMSPRSRCRMSVNRCRCFNQVLTNRWSIYRRGL